MNYPNGYPKLENPKPRKSSPFASDGPARFRRKIARDNGPEPV